MTRTHHEPEIRPDAKIVLRPEIRSNSSQKSLCVSGFRVRVVCPNSSATRSTTLYLRPLCTLPASVEYYP